MHNKINQNAAESKLKQQQLHITTCKVINFTSVAKKKAAIRPSPNAATWICAACPPSSPPQAVRLAGCCAKRLTQSGASRACPRFVDYAICYHYTTYNQLCTADCWSTWPMLLEPNLSLRTLNPRVLIRRLQKLPEAAASKVRPCRAAPPAGNP